MNMVTTKIVRFLYKLQDFYPTLLPVGLTEFNKWAQRLIFTYEAPDNPSIYFSLAAMILHLDSTTHRKSRRFFGKAITKGASNEVASYVMRDLKAKRDALIEAEDKRLKDEAVAALAAQTATQVPANEQRQ